MKNIRLIIIGIYIILGQVSSSDAITQTIKTTDDVEVRSLNLRDDMKSYQIIYKEHVREYNDYYKTVREKIAQKLKYNYRDYYRDGDVDIFFLLNSNGTLGRIDIDLGKSTSDRKLIDMVLYSLQEASPFAPFPEELDAAELPFNITISFKENSN